MSRQIKILKCQYAFAIKSDIPNLLVIVDEDDLTNWYFKIINLPEPYLDGEFIFKLSAPETFPRTPPIFSFITPNGVYEPGGKVCISIGEFHGTDYDKDSDVDTRGSYGWRPALGMIGFAREVVNGLIVSDYLKDGVRIEKTPITKKIKLSLESIKYNQTNYKELENRFDSVEDDHPDLSAVKQKKHRAQMKIDCALYVDGKLKFDIFKKYLPDNIYKSLLPVITSKNKSKLVKIILIQDYSDTLKAIKIMFPHLKLFTAPP